MLDPELTEENLEAIAANTTVLTTDTLEDLAEHRAAWPELTAWAHQCIANDEITPLSEFVMPEEPEVAPLPTRKHRLPKWTFAVAGAVVLLGAGGAYAASQPEQPANEPAAASQASSSPTPEIVDVMDGLTASGDGFTCTATGDQIRCWGQNNRGQLGAGAGMTSHEETIEIADVTMLSAGKDFACASDGTGVTCWGDNRWKQAGDSSKETLQPTAIPALEGKQIDSLSAGEIHACATTEGTVTCWGSDYSGQLGTGKKGAAASSPVDVALPEDTKALTVTSSRFGACVSTDLETLLCWGSNDEGRISENDATILPVSEVGTNE